MKCWTDDEMTRVLHCTHREGVFIAMMTTNPCPTQGPRRSFQCPALSGSPVFLALMCTILLGGCFESTRVIKRSAYWEVVKTRPLDARQGRTKSNVFHPNEVAPVHRTDWALLSVTDNKPAVTYPERCVQAVAIDRIQYEDVQYHSGWKNHIALWGLSLGAPALVGGGLELSQAADTPSAALVDGNPNVQTRVTFSPQVAERIEDFIDMSNTVTSMPVVSAIPTVCEAAAGIRTYADLPLITGYYVPNI